jgi:hypothetical protein
MNITISKLKFCVLAFSISFLSCQEDIREVILYTAGTTEASSTKTDIKFGETVSFSSSSTKVRSRKWTFEAGSPSNSIDPNVVVTYPVGKTDKIYTATLEVTYVDNQVDKKTFYITVEPAPPVPAIDGLKIYSDDSNFTATASTTSWIIANNYVVTDVASGGYADGGVYKSLALPAPATANWSMAYLSFSNFTNITAYTYLNVAVRTTSTGKVRFRMKDAAQTGFVEFDATSNLYGLKRDGNWNMVKIPLAAYKSNNPLMDLTKIKDILVVRSVDPPGGDDVKTLNNFSFDIDQIYLSK